MNYHKTPNHIYDKFPEMKEGELRLTLWLIRNTYGYHRNGVQTTSAAIAEEIGLSKQGLINAQNAVQERGFFVRVNGGYEVNEINQNEAQEVNLVDHDTPSQGQRSRPKRSTKLTTGVNEVDQKGQLSRPTTSGLKKERNIKENIKEKRVYTPAKTPAHFDNFNALTGNGDIGLSADDKLLKEQLVKAIKAIVTNKTALPQIYDLADTCLEKGVTPETLTQLFGADGWWFTSCKLNIEKLPPYVKNIVNELDKALASLEVKQATPDAYSPAAIMAHVDRLRGLTNGAYKEAWANVPAGVKSAISQAMKAKRILVPIGELQEGQLSEADFKAILLERTGV